VAGRRVVPTAAPQGQIRKLGPSEHFGWNLRYRLRLAVTRRSGTVFE